MSAAKPTPDPPSLRELQHRLEAVLSCGGNPSASETLARAAARLPIAGDERLDAAGRLDVYATGIFLRIYEAIAEDYPATLAASGPEAFRALVARYLDAHPTNHPDLRQAGRHLPRFLRAAEPRWRAELAELELALTDSFVAADAPALRAEDLRSLPPESWPELWLAGVPSLRLLAHESSSDTIRARLLAGEPPRPDPGEPVRLCVWRRAFSVFLRRVDSLEHGALQHLSTGLSFADLCAWLDEQGTAEDPSAVAVRLLDRWLADEVLRAPFPRTATETVPREGGLSASAELGPGASARRRSR